MITVITCVTVGISIALFSVLWFWIVHRELRNKRDTVKSAAAQLAACRKKHLQTMDSSEEGDVKSILSRSLDIYRQSITLYNHTLMKPWNRIPAFLMGFRQINESENT